MYAQKQRIDTIIEEQVKLKKDLGEQKQKYEMKLQNLENSNNLWKDKYLGAQKEKTERDQKSVLSAESLKKRKDHLAKKRSSKKVKKIQNAKILKVQRYHVEQVGMMLMFKLMAHYTRFEVIGNLIEHHARKTNGNLSIKRLMEILKK